MTVGAHLVGWLVLAVVGAGAALLAVGARRVLLPSAEGAPARLAEAILAVSAGCLLIETVGVAGELSRAGLAAGALVTVAAGALLLRRSRVRGRASGSGAVVARDGRGGVGGARRGRAVLVAGLLVIGAAGAVAGLWFAQVGWTLQHGVLDYDSLNYHLPFALDWFQTGRVGPLVLASPDSPVATYPADPELFHAAAMTAFQRDVLTPFLNLGWLALAALAGWTVGRRRGAPLAGLATVVAVASLPVIVQSQPGTAMTDMAVLAALLACVALLLEAPRNRGWLFVSGLAVGLALGSKLTAVAAVGALAIVVIVVARHAAWGWFAGLALTGGFWYVRNVIVTGSPIPSLHIPGLPSGHYHAFDSHSGSVAGNLGNLDVVTRWYLPSLHDGFGPLWPVLLLLIAAGTVAAVVVGVRGGRATRVLALLGAATATALVAFLVTPTTGGLLFGTGLRYLLPAGLLGLVLVVLALPLGSRYQHAYAALLGAFAIVNVAAGWRLRWFYPSSPRPAVALATAGVALLLGLLLLAGRAAARRRAAAAAAAVQMSALRSGTSPLSDALAGGPELVESPSAQSLPAAHYHPAAQSSPTQSSPTQSSPTQSRRLTGQAGQASLTTVRVAAVLLVAALVPAVTLPLERSYLNNRYAHAMQVDSIDTRAYAYFRGVSGVKVAVGGVPETYPYSGVDLSNRVDYLGHREPHGQLAEIDNCAEWLGRLAKGRYDYVVVAASAFDGSRPPQADWTLHDPTAQPVLDFRGGVVIRLHGPPNPISCGAPTGSPA